MILAGRCKCGVTRELAAEDPEPHLACNGQKRCPGCLIAKSLSSFWKYGAAKKHRPYSRCKVCWRAGRREKYQSDQHTRERIKENARAYYGRNKLKVIDRKAQWYKDNQERERARARTYRDAHRAEELARQRRFQAANKEMLYKRRKALDARRKAA